MADTVTVTVLETATIFEGPDTVYRYDIMATGILEGWAIPAVVDQVQQLASVHWPEVEVVIDGDDQVTDMLTKTFIGKGVTSYPVETLREHPLPETEPETDSDQGPDPNPGPVITRPTRGKTHRDFYGIRPLHLVLTALFVGSVAGGWVLVGGGDAPASPPPSPTPPQAVAPAPTSTSAGVTGTEGGRASTSVVEGEDFHLEVPAGYRMQAEGEGHVVTGPDPDLRIHIAIDPLYGVDPVLVAEELEQLIAGDPGLERTPVEEQGRIGYLEDPGDGSEVAWVTWLDADRQINVGCHTRVEPTVVQKAACRQAAESLRVG